MGGAAQRGRLSSETPARGEAFHLLASFSGVRIEHIVSSDSSDTAEQRQDWDEWVLLTAGGAELDVDGQQVRLEPGQWLVLPAGIRHRVLTTTSGSHWIAVHGPASAGQ